jgi:hypothetical protein
MAPRAGDRAPRYWGRQDCTMVSAHLRDAGVGGGASASELLGQHCFVRARAAQAAPNIWLESLHLGTLRGNPVEIFGAQFGAPLGIFKSGHRPQSGSPLFSVGRERPLNQAPNCFRARGSVGLLLGPLLNPRFKCRRQPHCRHRILAGRRPTALFLYYGN